MKVMKNLLEGDLNPVPQNQLAKSWLLYLLFHADNKG